MARSRSASLWTSSLLPLRRASVARGTSSATMPNKSITLASIASSSRWNTCRWSTMAKAYKAPIRLSEAPGQENSWWRAHIPARPSGNHEDATRGADRRHGPGNSQETNRLCEDNLAAGGEVIELAHGDDVLDLPDEVVPGEAEEIHRCLARVQAGAGV